MLTIGIKFYKLLILVLKSSNYCEYITRSENLKNDVINFIIDVQFLYFCKRIQRFVIKFYQSNVKDIFWMIGVLDNINVNY